MAGPSQALVLKFSTDLGEAQKNIASFAANAVSNLASIASKAQTAKAALDFMSKNAGAIKIGIAGFVGFEALMGAVHLLESAAGSAQAQLEKLVKIGAAASNAGVGTTFFQSWAGQAKELNLQTSDLVAMLEKARQAATQNIGIDKDKTDLTTGSAGGDRIKQNVMAGNLPQSALANYNSAGSQEARIQVVLGLREQLKQKGAELSAFDLAKTFFGETFETQLRNGVDMIGKMRTALNGLEVANGERIIPQSEIANAQRMSAELDAINDKLAKASAPLLNDVAVAEQTVLEIAIKIKSVFADLVGLIGSVTPNLAEWKANIDALWSGRSTLQLAEVFGKGGQFGAEEFGPNQPKDSELPALTIRGDKSKPLPSLMPKAPKAASAASQTNQVETYIQSLQKAAAAEEAEAKTLGMSNKAKQEAIDLAKAEEAGNERKKPLSADEAGKVKALADAYVDAKDKIEAYNKAQESAKETASFFGNALEGALEKTTERGARLEDIFMSLAKSIEQAALKAVLLGEGPLASLFGTAPAQGATGTGAVGGLFGMAVNGAQSSGLLGGIGGGIGSFFSGFHADGGTIPAGHWGVAGEAGAEIINGPATITPMKHINAALNASANGRGPANVYHTAHYNIDARGAQVGVAEQISSAIQSHQAYLERNLPAMINKSAKRYG